MSKSQVKKLLAGMSKEEVINIVMELYDARKEARDYLDYYVNPNESNELEKFKKIVFKEFGDDGIHDPGAVSAYVEKRCRISRNLPHRLKRWQRRWSIMWNVSASSRFMPVTWGAIL